MDLVGTGAGEQARAGAANLTGAQRRQDLVMAAWGGGAAVACSCARLATAAATIFMALVIFCVDWTLRIPEAEGFGLGIRTCGR